jgi:bifunctional non-homologous end joining protein LigD
VASKGVTAQYRFGDVTVSCTNVDRVVFPDAGVTKGDILAYYRDVADAMVPELARRPLTLERFTKGIAGGGFFQKHWQKHFPAWIDRVEVAGKTRVVYPICNDAASLVYFANQGAIALHVTTARKDALEHPDLIVFDLDPPDGGFELVRRVARMLRDVLGELGLPAFVKTSGSKGLHVVSPVDGEASYAEVGRLCGAITQRLIAQHPDVVTTEFYKKDRKGRLFLDTMRNGFGATVVAPYSLRGRPGAPVSAPITWDEVDDPKLAPDGLRLRAVLERLEAWGDPWHELRAKQGSVSDAIGKLED